MKKILVIIDMQNDFVNKEVLGNDECQAVIPKIVEKIQTGDYTHIIFTQDTHTVNYMNTQEGKNLPVPHCIAGTVGHCIVEDIRNAAQRTMKPLLFLNKKTFGSKNLAENIMTLKPDEVEFVGVCTSICVVSNVLGVKMFNPEIPLIVDASCCACVTPESHKHALETMKMCQINIINEED